MAITIAEVFNVEDSSIAVGVVVLVGGIGLDMEGVVVLVLVVPVLLFCCWSLLLLKNLLKKAFIV